MEQPCKHEPVCAFGLAERQAVDPKNFQCRVQELERVAFSAIAPPCHVYPELVLYRPTGLPLCQKFMTDPREPHAAALPRKKPGWSQIATTSNT
jgi:hypothetical protein